MVKKTIPIISISLVILLSVTVIYSKQTSMNWHWQDVFLTRDQQGWYFYNRQQYALAASRFEQEQWQAMAWYAAENFSKAAKLWGRLPGADSLFNRANALAHLKDYKNAADSYRLALVLEPGWSQAQENLSLIEVLAEKPDEVEEYFAQTDGKMEADDFSFEKNSKRFDNAEDESGEGQGEVSSKEIQALWMHRLQSTPADFLRLKFRYQYEMNSKSADAVMGKQ